MASPTESPEAIPDVPRQVELAQDHRHAERADDADADEHQRDDARRPADVDEDEDQRCDQCLRDDERRPQSDSIRDRRRAAASRPRLRAASGRAAGLPSAFEWPSETTHSGTNARSVNHATLRNAITMPSSAIARRRSSPRSSRRRVSGRRERREVRSEARERGRGDEDRHHRDETPDETEPDDELPGRERAERVADVPAAVEVRHAARLPVPARVRRELGALGMERCNAEAARKDQEQHEGIDRCDRRPADADGRERAFRPG